MRNVGMHAGGVLIAPGKITDFCPLYMQPGSASAVSQFDKDDVEAIGLVKFDFLGLATLDDPRARQGLHRRAPSRSSATSRTRRCRSTTRRSTGSSPRAAPSRCSSSKARGMRRMLKDAQPNRLEDLIALNAMFRPGPMENIPSFCARKHGREEVRYPHPLLETVLGETYGIMVYQEQVMQAGADPRRLLARRRRPAAPAMGKKKPEEMAKHRDDLPRGRGEEGHLGRGRRRGLRPDGEVRRLRLQQVARRRVLAARLPHGVDQGPLRGRVLRRQHVGRDRQQRQAEGARSSTPRPSA